MQIRQKMSSLSNANLHYNSLDAGQFGLLLSAISSSKREVNHQLSLFCKEIHKSSSNVMEKLAKKFKATKSIEFKRKGNKKQYLFNEELDGKLDKVEYELQKSPLKALPSGTEIRNEYD